MRRRFGLTAIVLAVLAAVSQVQANELEPERIPTEELVEGIKSSDGRWFEVEIIVFAHENQKELRETFSDDIKNLGIKNSWDRLTNYLYPDIYFLRSSLPQCWRKKDPFYEAEEQYQPTKSPAMFFMQYQSYQKLITSDWQISEELCLLPSESQTPFWQFMAPATYLSHQPVTFAYSQMPVTIQGADHDDYRDVYLIAEQNLQLTDEFKKLKSNRNTRPLLHMGWRLPGQAERITKPFMIRAGRNFTDEFDYQGNARPNKEALKPIKIEDTEQNSLTASLTADKLLNQADQSRVDEFMQQLNQGAVVDFKNKTLIRPEQNDFPEETWELDGFIKVHLNHYLFLDAEFNYRERHTERVAIEEYLQSQSSLLIDDKIQTDLANDTGGVIISAIKRDDDSPDEEQTERDTVDVEYLKVFPLKQRRRTYSGDLHYLDHPKIGVLFQIRKYRH